MLITVLKKKQAVLHIDNSAVRLWPFQGKPVENHLDCKLDSGNWVQDASMKQSEHLLPSKMRSACSPAPIFRVLCHVTPSAVGVDPQRAHTLGFAAFFAVSKSCQSDKNQREYVSKMWSHRYAICSKGLDSQWRHGLQIAAKKLLTLETCRSCRASASTKPWLMFTRRSACCHTAAASSALRPRWWPHITAIIFLSSGTSRKLKRRLENVEKQFLHLTILNNEWFFHATVPSCSSEPPLSLENWNLHINSHKYRKMNFNERKMLLNLHPLRFFVRFINLSTFLGGIVDSWDERPENATLTASLRPHRIKKMFFSFFSMSFEHRAS